MTLSAKVLPAVDFVAGKNEDKLTSCDDGIGLAKLVWLVSVVHML